MLNTKDFIDKNVKSRLFAGKKILLLCSIITSLTVKAQTPQWQLCNVASCYTGNNCFFEFPSGVIMNSGYCASIDSGFTWSLASNTIYAESYIENSAGIFAGSDSAIYFSNNNGSSWANVFTTGTYNFVIGLAVLNDTVFAATRTSGILMSPDNGSTWTQVNAGLPNDSIYSILAKDNLLFAGMYGNGIYMSSNSGVSWTSANSGLPASSIVRSIATDGINIYATCNGLLFLSNNNGASWTQAIISGTHLNKIISVGNAILVGGTSLSGGVFRSLDNGITWSLFDNGISTTCGYWVSSLYATLNYVLLGTGETGCPSEIYRIDRNSVITSLNDNTDLTKNVLQVFPNPFSSEINFKVNNNSDSELFLYDITNRKLSQHSFTNAVTLNTLQLDKGIYLYEIKDSNGLNKKGKVVKN